MLSKKLENVALFENGKYSKQLWENLQNTLKILNDKLDCKFELVKERHGYKLKFGIQTYWTGTLAEMREYIMGIYSGMSLMGGYRNDKK